MTAEERVARALCAFDVAQMMEQSRLRNARTIDKMQAAAEAIEETWSHYLEPARLAIAAYEAQPVPAEAVN